MAATLVGRRAGRPTAELTARRAVNLRAKVSNCTLRALGRLVMRSERASKALFGVPGLDDVLAGGLARNRLYLLEGAPGSGKTTLALQFLLDGARLGERGLY